MAGNNTPRNTREALLDQLFSDHDELLEKVEKLQAEIPAASSAATKAIEAATQQAEHDLKTASQAVHEAMGARSAQAVTDIDSATKRLQDSIGQLNAHEASRQRHDRRLMWLALVTGMLGGTATAALVGIVAAFLLI